MFSRDLNNRLATRVTFPDIVLIFLLAAASFLPAIFRASHASEKALFVEEVLENSPNLVLPLRKDGIYHLAGHLGDSIAEIKNGRVRMKKSPCPNKTCVREGWKAKAGQVIICAPNRVGLLLRGKKEPVDVITR